jgi:uncharacterized protein
MNIRALLLSLTMVLALSGPAAADPMSSGMAAFRRGDYLAAARLLGPLAERGYPAAQTILGFMYQYGRGVPQNYDVAAHWYECAAEQGDPSAQYQFGLMFDKGHGVPRSAIIAYKWLDLAAAHASRSQRDYYTRIRNAVASKLNNAQKTEAQALAYEWVPKPAP